MSIFLKFILGFILLSTGLEASDKKLALIRRIQGLEQLPESISRQLRTTTLMVVTKQKDYEVLLSGTDSPTSSVVDMVAVESEIGRKGRLFRIETRLLDIKKQKLISRASLNDIREEDLVRLFQGALESLFLQEARKLKASEEKAKEENTSDKQSSSVKKKLPSTSQFSQPNHSALDFKQRLRELKSDTEEGIAKVAEKENAKSAKENAKKEPPPSRDSQAKTQLSFSESPFKKEGVSKVGFPSKHAFHAGYDSRQVDSDYYISTSTKVQLLTLKAAGHFPLSIFQGSLAGSYDFAYSRALSAPIELPIVYQLGLYATWLSPSWSTSIGLKRDSSFFSNLPSPGEGIQPQTIATTWLRVRGDMVLDIKGIWEIEASYGIPMLVETDYLPLQDVKKWQGSSLNLSITPPISYKKWKATLAIDKTNLTSQGDQPFTLNESRMALFAKRSL